MTESEKMSAQRRRGDVRFQIAVAVIMTAFGALGGFALGIAVMAVQGCR
jgi:hypothetical protein